MQTESQRHLLLTRLERSQVFNQVWTSHLASQALQQGSYPASLLQAAPRAIAAPEGFLRVMARFLASPLSRQDVERRAHLPIPPTPTPTPTPAPTPTPSPTPSKFSVGAPIDSYFSVNKQMLVPDPVTDPAAYGTLTARVGAASGAIVGVPLDSPWGQAAVFLQVCYDAIMAGDAPSQRCNSRQPPSTTGQRPCPGA
ncbi:hypothetical protein [Singulisphaera sp. PoT]|uniref:hypothetical protein n=1 Tax=Singulisphaera sp. PoT TaxID=3411797 RepID=UPI003BF555D6